MKKDDYLHEISVQCGKVTDGVDKLTELCKKEAEKLLTTIDVPEQMAVSVPFWTSDFPELICVGEFRKNSEGKVVYELDFSESTL